MHVALLVLSIVLLSGYTASNAPLAGNPRSQSVHLPDRIPASQSLAPALASVGTSSTPFLRTIATYSMCNGTLTSSRQQVFCNLDNPLSLIEDSYDRLVIVGNGYGFGFTHYVMAYNDSTNQVVWVYNTWSGSSGLAGQEPSSMAYDPGNGDLFIVDSQGGAVDVLNASTGLQLSVLRVPSPVSVAIDGSHGELYLGEAGTPGRVALYNASTWSFVKNVTTNVSRPNHETFDPASSTLYVSDNFGNDLVVVSTTSNKQIKALGTGSSPEGMIFDPTSSELFVTNSGNNNLTVVNTKTNTIAIKGVSGSNMSGPVVGTFDPVNGLVYVGSWTGGYLSVINGTTNKAVNAITVGSNPLMEGMSYAADTKRVYFAGEDTLLEYYTPSSNNTTTVSSASPSGGAFDPLNHVLYVTSANGCSILPMNLTTHALLTGIRAAGCREDGAIFDPKNGLLYVEDSGGYCCFGAINVIDPRTGSSVASIGTGYYATGMALDLTDNRLYVTGYYNMTEINLSTNAWVRSYASMAGNYASSLVWDPVHDYILQEGNGQISVFNASNGSMVRQRGTSGTGSDALAFDSNTSQIFLAQSNYGHIAVLDESNLTYVANLSCGCGPDTMMWDPTTHFLLDSASLTAQLYEVNATTDKIVGSIYTGVGAPQGSRPAAMVSLGGFGLDATLDGTGSITFFTTANRTVPVSVTESGLPYGTNWSTAWGGTSISSRVPSETFLTHEKSGRYAISNPTGWTGFPPKGTIDVAGQPAQVNVRYGAGRMTLYPTTVREAGLPTGAWWSAAIGNFTLDSDLQSLGVQLPNGTYSLSVSAGAGFNVSSPSTLSIAGAPVHVSVVFTPAALRVTFNERGLASGSVWTITIGSVRRSSTARFLTFYEENGSYTFTASSHGYIAKPASGTFSVAGAKQLIVIRFS